MRMKERLPENDVRVFIFSSHATGIEGDGKSLSPSITDPKETHGHRLRASCTTMAEEEVGMPRLA